MDEDRAVELMEELGVRCEVGTDTYEAMLDHPTVNAYINGDVSISQAIFVEEYLANGFNAAKAAQAAKYSAFKRDGYAKIGTSVLRNKKVKALVARRIAERAMTANEVIDRIREVADGSIADMINDSGYVDLQRARDRKKLHLIKEINIDEDGGAKIKLRDQDKALDSLARSLGVFEKDNRVNLPPEVVALLGLNAHELDARKDAYEQMEEWEEEDAATSD